MRDKLTTITGSVALGILLLGVTLLISACSSGSTSNRSGSAYDPYYYDNRYRTGVYSHHRAYRSAYGAPRYGGRRYR